MAKTTKKTIASKKTTSRKSASVKTAPTGSTPSRRSKTTATEAKKDTAKRKTAAETEVTLDRRRSDRRTNSESPAFEARKIERRVKVTRRRQIDPTTCERDYSDEEVEFMNALDNYKRSSGRMFPTCSEILEVIRELGYGKVPAVQPESPEVSSPPAQEGPALVEANESQETSLKAVHCTTLLTESVSI